MVTMETTQMEMYPITMLWGLHDTRCTVALHVSVVIPSPWRAKWLPFGVWNTQDITNTAHGSTRSSPRVVGHSMVLLSHSQMHWSCAPPALGYRPHHYYVWCVSILMDSTRVLSHGSMLSMGPVVQRGEAMVITGYVGHGNEYATPYLQ